MSHIDRDIDRLAYENSEMPEKLDFPEQLLFLSLRYLYGSCRHGYIDATDGKREKMLIIRQYERYAFFSRLFTETATMRNKIAHYAAEMNKHGCAICKKAVAVFQGRDE